LKYRKRGRRQRTRKMRGGSLVRVSADAQIARDGILMSVEDALELSTNILHKD
jgi:hypothetical protein